MRGRPRRPCRATLYPVSCYVGPSTDGWETNAGEGLWVIRADGSGKPQSLTQSKNAQVPWSFTPDGKRLAFFEQDSKT